MDAESGYPCKSVSSVVENLRRNKRFEGFTMKKRGEGKNVRGARKLLRFAMQGNMGGDWSALREVSGVAVCRQAAGAVPGGVRVAINLKFEFPICAGGL